MRSKRILLMGALMGALLLTLSLSAVAQQSITPRQGSAATFVLKPARAAIASTDTTPPVTTAGPIVSGTTDTGTTLSATIDEYGSGYFLIQLSAAAAPNVATVQSSGTSFAMTANVAATQVITGLTGSTPYKLYFVAKDGRNNVQAVVAMVAFTTLPDTTPPVTTAGPSVPAKSDTTATLSATINEVGTGYYLAQPAVAAAPSVAAVKAGTAFAMTANAAASASVLGLTGSTNYIIYFIAKDASNNWQAAYSQVAVTTDPDTTPPITTAGPSVSSTAATSTILSATINEAGTGYYLVQLAAAAAPSVATVQGSGISFGMAANTAATPTVTGLTASTSYKIYFVAKDTSNNWQAAVQMAAFTTTADQCTITASSAAINACCTSTNTVHQSFGRAYTSFGIYYPTGGFTNLGAAGTTTNLKKTSSTVWTSVGSCP